MSTDPYWNNVVLNLRMEGGSLTDDKGHTPVLAGSAALSSLQAYAGTQSLGFNPVTSGYVAFNSPDLNLGGLTNTYEFCIEAWVYLDRGGASTGNLCGIFDSLALGGNGGRTDAMILGITSDNKPFLFFGGSFRIISPDAIQQNVWTHIALTRQTSTPSDPQQPVHIRLFVNGIFKGEVANGINSPSATTIVNIGAVSDIVAAYPFQGFIDEFRMTLQTPRYTENFTPPTSLWDGGTVEPPVEPTGNAEILPYNPSIGIRERFTWATSHIQTWSAEERTELRELPAYSADYKINSFSEAKMDALIAFYRANQTLPVRVPMWSSPAYIVDVEAGDTLIPLSPTNPVQPIRYLLQDDMEVIVWLSPQVYELHKIDFIDAAGAHLVDPLANSYSHCYFLVCLTGLISGSSFSKSANGRKSWNFTFTCPWVYIEEYPFSGNFDIFDEKVLISTDFTKDEVQKAELVDSPLGLQTKVQMEGIVRKSWNCGLYAREFVDIMTLKRKLAWFRGKARSLLFPYENLHPDAASTTAVCLGDDSVTFSFSPKYQCTASVTFVENLLALPPYVPIVSGGQGWRYVTLFDWDGTLLRNVFNDPSIPVVSEDPARPTISMDGHVTVSQLTTGSYLVVEATGAYSSSITSPNLAQWNTGNMLNGSQFTELLGSASGSYYEAAPDVGDRIAIFAIYSNVMPMTLF